MQKKFFLPWIARWKLEAYSLHPNYRQPLLHCKQRLIAPKNRPQQQAAQQTNMIAARLMRPCPFIPEPFRF